MNVEIGAEAAQFPEKEYINGKTKKKYPIPSARVWYVPNLANRISGVPHKRTSPHLYSQRYRNQRQMFRYGSLLSERKLTFWFGHLTIRTKQNILIWS